MNHIKIEAWEIEHFRNETNGTQHCIHLNNAGASLMPDPVRDVVIDYLQHESRHGGYETAAAYGERLEHIYTAIARLIHAKPLEIAVVENATVAWQLAFHSLRFEAGDEILTTNTSYATNYLNFLQAQKRYGVEIRIASNDEFGQVSPKSMEATVNKRTKLIALTHIPTNGGLINPAEEVGRVAKAHQIPYLLDACQSIGQLNIDVKKIECDFLSATGRKYLRGPRGTGFLYVKESILEQAEPPFIDMHAATWMAPDQYKWREGARRFENWENNLAAKLGLARAVDYALGIGLDRIELRIKTLAAYFRKMLRDIPHCQVHDLGKDQCGIVSLSKTGISASDLRHGLTQENINTSVTPRESTLLDMQDRKLGPLLRASVHYYNTEEELNTFCQTIAAL